MTTSSITRALFILGITLTVYGILTGAPVLGIAVLLLLPDFFYRLLAEINSGDTK